MKFAFFQGCNIPTRIEQYSQSAKAVVEKFGVELAECKDFNCCGYPMRNINEKAYLLPSIRNLAVAEKEELDIAVLCNCCFQSLLKADRAVQQDPQLLKEINEILKDEGLSYSGGIQVVHFLSILYEKIGLEEIKKQIRYHIKDLRIGVLHGCHLLRPREITRFDNTFFPSVATELLGIMGVTNSDFHKSLECCGAALAGVNDELSISLLAEKVDNAKAEGAECMIPLCSYCYLQFEARKEQVDPIDIVLFPQLLGLCLGIDKSDLGFEKNKPLKYEFLTDLVERCTEPEKRKRAKGQ